jgi:hypothetical protein
MASQAHITHAHRSVDPLAVRLTKPILNALDAGVRTAVLRRIEAMEREHRFLLERDNADARYLQQAGWEDARLHVLFALNSVYQLVLGPQQAAARGGPHGLGRETAVTHGSTRFSRTQAIETDAALKAFRRILISLEMPFDWLLENTCADAVYRIARYQRETRFG